MKVRLEEPESEFDELTREISAAVDEVMGRSLFRLVSSDAWEPEINIYEVRDSYTVCVNLAGMSADAIDVVIDGGMLQVSGVRPRPEMPKGSEDPSVHIMEIDSGRFERRISVPADVDGNSLSASYRNGFLWIRLSKQVRDSAS